jgi:cellulose synthase/poly-beta-1,6-N-acetylglucosamine synthase-like glycosyltransferase
VSLAEVVLWASIGAIVYTYLGYPVLLVAFSALGQLRSDWAYLVRGETRRRAASERLPSVAVVVAAYNEERHIGERIRNLLELDYPPDRLRIYIGSDCSNDATVEIAMSAATDRVTVVPFATRRGKPSVVNDLVARAAEDIVVFTDANTLFASDAVRRIVRRFEEQSVGCVSGELRLVAASGADNQDHIYWRYERFLKFFEARAGILLGANGGIYAVRRALYAPVPPNTIVDDFWISIDLVRRGHRCDYDPEAVAYEDVPDRIADEFGRRVRIGAGNFQALREFYGLLSPRRGMVAVAFLSHKVLRWFVPHLMIAAAGANLLMLDSPFYAVLAAAQCVFYGVAVVGYRMGRTGPVPRPLRLPLFFVSMNFALLRGFARYLSGKVGGAWERTAR